MKSLRDRAKESRANTFVDSSPEGAAPAETFSIPYPARLRASIDRRTRDYIDRYGKKGESINSLINDALEKLLDIKEAEAARIERLLSKAERMEEEG